MWYDDRHKHAWIVLQRARHIYGCICARSVSMQQNTQHASTIASCVCLRLRLFCCAVWRRTPNVGHSQSRCDTSSVRSHRMWDNDDIAFIRFLCSLLQFPALLLAIDLFFCLFLSGPIISSNRRRHQCSVNCDFKWHIMQTRFTLYLTYRPADENYSNRFTFFRTLLLDGLACCEMEKPLMPTDGCEIYSSCRSRKWKLKLYHRRIAIYIIVIFSLVWFLRSFV